VQLALSVYCSKIITTKCINAYAQLNGGNLMNDEQVIKVIIDWFKECNEENILPWEYDFKLKTKLQSTSNINQIENPFDEEDPVKRIFKWYCWRKTSSETETTELAKAIYSKLWGCDTSTLDRKLLDMDVMNSFWTIYQYSIKTKYAHCYYKRNLETFRTLLNDKYNDYRKINNLFTNFAKLTHTIGNFIIEPKGFNVGRGKGDYWDIALANQRKDWDKNKDIKPENYLHIIDTAFREESENDMLQTNSDTINVSFWEKNVNVLLLQPFVKENYEVAELWCGHLELSPELIHPEIKDNEGNLNKRETLDLICHFINNVCSRIEERGKHMVKKLCKKMGKTNYKFYQKNLQDLPCNPRFANNINQPKTELINCEQKQNKD
jgi:hypothetical protein